MGIRRYLQELHPCRRNFLNTRNDIKAICDEVETFSTLLTAFHRTITDNRLLDEGLYKKIKPSSIAQHIRKSGSAALRKIKDTLHPIEPTESRQNLCLPLAMVCALEVVDLEG